MTPACRPLDPGPALPRQLILKEGSLCLLYLLRRLVRLP